MLIIYVSAIPVPTIQIVFTNPFPERTHVRFHYSRFNCPKTHVSLSMLLNHNRSCSLIPTLLSNSVPTIQILFTEPLPMFIIHVSANQCRQSHSGAPTHFLSARFPNSLFTIQQASAHVSLSLLFESQPVLVHQPKTLRGGGAAARVGRAGDGWPFRKAPIMAEQVES